MRKLTFLSAFAIAPFLGQVCFAQPTTEDVAFTTKLTKFVTQKDTIIKSEVNQIVQIGTDGNMRSSTPDRLTVTAISATAIGKAGAKAKGVIIEITDFYDQDASSPRRLDSGVLALGATKTTTSKASFAIDEEDLSRFSESCVYLLKIASTMKGKDRDENGNGEYQDAYFITKGGLAINVGYSENEEGEDEEPTVIVASADQRKLLTKMPLDEVSDLSKLQQAIDKSILWLRSK